MLVLASVEDKTCSGLRMKILLPDINLEFKRQLYITTESGEKKKRKGGEEKRD